MENFNKFLDYLLEKEIGLYEDSILENENAVKINIPQDINGRSLNFDVIFDKEDSFVDIYCNGIFTIKEENIVDAVSLVNGLNIEYRALTFYIQDNEISVKSSIIVNENFSPEVVFIVLSLINKVIEKTTNLRE